MKKSSLFLALAIFAITAINMANAQTYDPYAVQVINNLIANNGLNATPNAPETWEFATWNDEIPKKILKLYFGLGGMSMTGDASFVGLTTLQALTWGYGYLTKLDVTNCAQLQILSCMGSLLTEINLTNCTQLQRLICSKNKLSKLDIINCDNLYELTCYENNLTELDVTNNTQLKYLECAANNLTELDVKNCTKLDYLNCSNNKLIAIDLLILDSLNYFYGQVQYPLPLTLYKNESNKYTIPINLNSPIFGNTAISYENGFLISKDSTVVSCSFTVQTGKPGFTLNGELNFTYSNVGINTIDSGEFNIYPNPVTGELRITNYELRIMSIELFDVYGKNAGTYNHSFNTEIIINISHLQPSTYFVKITTEQGEIVKKIVKQ